MLISLPATIFSFIFCPMILKEEAGGGEGAGGRLELNIKTKGAVYVAKLRLIVTMHRLKPQKNRCPLFFF